MPRPRRAIALLIPLLVPLAACASGGAVAGAAAPSTVPSPAAVGGSAVVTPPRLLSSGDLRVTRTVVVAVGTVAPAPTPFTVEVQIDASGRADPGTLTIRGLSSGDAAETREGVLQWLRGARFEPARREGVAVPGVFRRTFGR